MTGYKFCLENSNNVLFGGLVEVIPNALFLFLEPSVCPLQILRAIVGVQILIGFFLNPRRV